MHELQAAPIVSARTQPRSMLIGPGPSGYFVSSLLRTAVQLSVQLYSCRAERGRDSRAGGVFDRNVTPINSPIIAVHVYWGGVGLPNTQCTTIIAVQLYSCIFCIIS